MKFLEKMYGLTSFSDEKVESSIFELCSFRQTDFKNSEWNNCLFISCDFSTASFSNASFFRCVFRNCTFNGGFLDNCKFVQCRAEMCVFESVLFGEGTLFDFMSTTGSSFKGSFFEGKSGIPHDLREVISEIIRQTGESVDIQAFAAFVWSSPDNCWENIVRMSKTLLSSENIARVEQSLRKFPRFVKYLDRHLSPKVG